MSVPTSIRAIVLDLNGVITTDMHRSLPDLQRALGASGSPQEFRDTWWSVYVEASRGAYSADEFWVRLQDVLGLESLPPDIEGQWLRSIRPCEENLPQILAILHQRYRLAVLSNHISRWAYRLLEEMQLLPRLDAVVISSDYKLRKPDPSLYIRSCEVLGVAPAEAAYVGDEQEDLAVPQQLGMLPIFVPGEDAHSNIGLRIESLIELIDLFCQGRT